MMKMVTGDDSPSGRVPEQGPDWFLVATEACGGGTLDLGFVLEVWGIHRRGWRQFHVGGAHRESTRQGARPRGGSLHPCGALETLLR